MASKNIGIDLDDVLANFMDRYMDICRELHGAPPIGTAPIDWEWSNLGLTRAQMDQSWQKVFDTHQFWTSLDLEKGVDPDLMQRLDDANELFFITARAHSLGDSTRVQSSRWLLNKLGMPFPRVMVSYDKGPLAAALKLDYFIDDRPKNCLEIKNILPDCKVFVKDACHNQPFNDPRIPRVRDFNEFAKIVLEENNG